MNLGVRATSCKGLPKRGSFPVGITADDNLSHNRVKIKGTLLGVSLRGPSLGLNFNSCEDTGSTQQTSVGNTSSQIYMPWLGDKVGSAKLRQAYARVNYIP